MNDEDLKTLASALFRCATKDVKPATRITKEMQLHYLQTLIPSATEDNLWRNPDGSIVGATA